MSDIIRIDERKLNTDKAIEFKGRIYDLPKRSKELNDKITELEKKRIQLNEYDFYAEFVKIVFGAKGSGAILKAGKENIDVIAEICSKAFDAIFENKIAMQKAEDEKKAAAFINALKRSGIAKKQPHGAKKRR